MRNKGGLYCIGSKESQRSCCDGSGRGGLDDAKAISDSAKINDSQPYQRTF